MYIGELLAMGVFKFKQNEFYRGSAALLTLALFLVTSFVPSHVAIGDTASGVATCTHIYDYKYGGDEGSVEIISRVISSLKPKLSLDDSYSYARYLFDTARDLNLDPLLLVSIMRVESDFRSDAVSSAGAVGLLQVLPSTGAYIAQQEGITWDKKTLYRSQRNIHIGAAYFKGLLEMYDGSGHLALTAYNMGPTRLNRNLKSNTFKGSSEYSNKVLSVYVSLTKTWPAFRDTFNCHHQVISVHRNPVLS